MFSWCSVSRSIDSFENVIFVCISSSKPAFGTPITTPSVVKGYAPLKETWKLRTSSCRSMIALLAAALFFGIARSCAS
jgi:hypothetical protein